MSPRVMLSFSVAANFIPDGVWQGSIKREATADTAYLLRLHRQLGVRMLRESRLRDILSVSVHLGDVGLLEARNGDLLIPLGPAKQSTDERASAVVDQINQRFGRETIRWGINRPHPGFFERG